MPSFAIVSLDREDLRNWLRAVLTYRGWSGSDLAKKIEVVPSTVNRFLNDPTATHTLSPRNLKAIEEATGFAPLKYPGLSPRGFSEPEAAPFHDGGSSGDPVLEEAVKSLLKRHQAIDPWTLKSRALEGAGFLPGDVVLVDLNEKPRARDVVCAQIYDWTRGKAETIFRIYEPPFLVSASTLPEFIRPQVVDEERVIIKGVVLQLVRPRRATVPAPAAA